MLLPAHNSRLKDCTVPMEILGISHNSSSYCLYSVGSISPIDTTAVDVASSYNNCSKIETILSISQHLMVHKFYKLLLNVLLI